MRVAVVDDIEPVPGPALAVAGRGEHPLDEVFVGGRVSVGDEGIDLFRCRREAEEIEGEAADECPSVGHGRGTHPLFSERGPHEGVDRVAVRFDARKRLKSLHRRRRIGVADRLPGPVVEARVAVGVPLGTGPGEAGAMVHLHGGHRAGTGPGKAGAMAIHLPYKLSKNHLSKA